MVTWARRTGQRDIGRTAALTLVLLAVSLSLASCGTSVSTPTGPAVSTAGVSDGSTPVPLPTQTANPARQPVIGGTEAAFTAKYGKPTGRGTDSSNGLPTVQYRGTGLVSAVHIELDASKTYVVGLVAVARADRPWNGNETRSICLALAPAGAQFQNPRNVTDQNNTPVAFYQLAVSEQLANTLPTTAFVDSQGQLVQAGTFGLEVYYVAGTNGALASACSLRLGDLPTLRATTS